MPRKQKKYHFIYKTTNLINNKFYVGMHSTDDLEDGYFGSGKIIHYSVNKHGIENHKVEILEFFDSREALKRREAEIINEELLANQLNMNLKFGGEGGWDHVEISPEELKERQRNGGKSSGKRNGPLNGFKSGLGSEHIRKKSAETINDRYEKWNIWHKGIKRSAKTKERNSLASKGEKNSQYGTCWVCKNDEVKKVPKEELQKWLSLGWQKGRKLSMATIL